jgi:hypothetical protein
MPSTKTHLRAAPFVALVLSFVVVTLFGMVATTIGRLPSGGTTAGGTPPPTAPPPTGDAATPPITTGGVRVTIRPAGHVKLGPVTADSAFASPRLKVTVTEDETQGAGSLIVCVAVLRPAEKIDDQAWPETEPPRTYCRPAADHEVLEFDLVPA